MGKISLRKHFSELRKTDRRHARELRKADSELRKAVVNAINTATSKQEAAYDKRFEAGNEIKGAMKEAQELQTRIQMPRAESEVRSSAQDVKIGALQDADIARHSQASGEQAGTDKTVLIIGAVVGVVGMLLAAFAILASRGGP